MSNVTMRVSGYDDLEDEPRFWNGLIGFAACMLVLVGGFHVIGGFVAWLEDEVYAVPSQDLALSVNYTVWGFLHMALGVGMILTAPALFWGRSWGRVVAVVLAMIGAMTNLTFLSAAPVWYGLMILLDILIIYAVIVHGGNREY